MKELILFVIYVLVIICFSFIIVLAINYIDDKRNKDEKSGKTDFNNDFKL